MRLFFIRHEERPDNPAFKTQLTESGQFRAATSIKDKLSKLGITTIFSSPFIRVLQTIQPFVLESGVKVKIDFGVSEGLNSSVFVPSDTFSTPDIECNIDASHISYYDEEFYYAPENEMDINQRVKIFLDVLLKRYGNTNETILIENQKGNSANAIQIKSNVGGINLNSKKDIYLNSEEKIQFNSNNSGFQFIGTGSNQITFSISVTAGTFAVGDIIEGSVSKSTVIHRGVPISSCFL